MNGIQLDTDIEEMNTFRYNLLVETFGKEEADKLMGLAPDADDEGLDADLQELVDTAGTLDE